VSGKRGQGPADNPWVRQTASEEAPTELQGQELPPSPWTQEVPPPPWAQQPADGAGEGPPAPGPTGPGTGEPTGWGQQISPPSLRRPAPEPQRRIPPVLLPIAGAVALVVVVGIVLAIVLSGGDEPAVQPTPTPTPGPTTPPATSYSPPPNAIQVGGGVSVVPAQGWTLYAAEKQGKQLVVPAPGGDYRAWFWVRQKRNLSAKDYVIRIAEGEITRGRLPRMSTTRNVPCPRDVLVECSAITYSYEVGEGGRLEGYVEAYRRKDGMVTAIDFITRPDFSRKAYADAQVMKKSVIDSM
jgi:hypothetical protein